MVFLQKSIENLTDEEYDAIYAEIPIERRRRLGRIRNRNDMKLSVVGDGIVRQSISMLSGKPTAELTFSRDHNGKPCCTSNPEIEFNLSHSGEYAVCAASDRKIGVDIEQLRRVRFRIARRLCTPEEFTYIFGVPKLLSEDSVEERDIDGICKRLLTIWTLKESYFKNIGCGIIGRLRTVSFAVDGDYNVKCSEPGYKFTLKFDIPGYVCSVCEEE